MDVIPRVLSDTASCTDIFRYAVNVFYFLPGAFGLCEIFIAYLRFRCIFRISPAAGAKRRPITVEVQGRVRTFVLNLFLCYHFFNVY